MRTLHDRVMEEIRALVNLPLQKVEKNKRLMFTVSPDPRKNMAAYGRNYKYMDLTDDQQHLLLQMNHKKFMEKLLDRTKRMHVNELHFEYRKDGNLHAHGFVNVPESQETKVKGMLMSHWHACAGRTNCRKDIACTVTSNEYTGQGEYKNWDEYINKENAYPMYSFTRVRDEDKKYTIFDFIEQRNIINHMES